MERFISTCFFLFVKDSLQKGVHIDTQVLENSYNRFATLLFSEGSVGCKIEYRNNLAYTRVEFSSLTPVSEKKCGNLSEQSHSTNQ